MIIINLKGGLGNQMFQYATGLFIANKNKQELKIDATGYSDLRVINSDTHRTFDLEEINISAQIASKEEIKKVKYPFGLFSKALRLIKTKTFRKFYLDYHPELFKNKNFYLDGFFQSEENFKEIRNIILSEFTLKKETDNFKNVINLINNNSISIHVRHGDYLNDPKTLKHHGILDLNYYKKAYELIKNKIDISQVIFFSDDPSWVKENFNFIDKPMIYASDFNLTAPEELILMSKCSNNIIANSSFSWWSAWLNQNPDKIVIAPNKWLKNGDGPHKNIVPKTWIRI